MKKCEITGKTSTVGGRYSNAVRATQYNPCGAKRRQVNLQKRKYFVEEIGKNVIVNISTRGIRTIAKNGVYKTLKKAGLIK